MRDIRERREGGGEGGEKRGHGSVFISSHCDPFLKFGVMEGRWEGVGVGVFV